MYNFLADKCDRLRSTAIKFTRRLLCDIALVYISESESALNTLDIHANIQSSPYFMQSFCMKINIVVCKQSG